jgi:hypothetical protein
MEYPFPGKALLSNRRVSISSKGIKAKGPHAGINVAFY